jgi:hypothetical protein
MYFCVMKFHLWSSYDRIWFSGPHEQDILILILMKFHYDLRLYRQTKDIEQITAVR